MQVDSRKTSLTRGSLTHPCASFHIYGVHTQETSETSLSSETKMVMIESSCLKRAVVGAWPRGTYSLVVVQHHMMLSSFQQPLPPSRRVTGKEGVHSSQATSLLRWFFPKVNDFNGCHKYAWYFENIRIISMIFVYKWSNAIFLIASQYSQNIFLMENMFRKYESNGMRKGKPYINS